MSKNFKEKIFQIVKKIPLEKTMSYKEVAKKAGFPKAWRAVGNVLAQNKNSEIPCHRVVKSNGSIGGYNLGIKKKKEILQKEGVFFQNRVCEPKFFNQSVLKVAPNLLGKFLVRKYKNKEISLMITEVEAYDGYKDKASHAYKGKTKRNKVMFYSAGHWYVYFTYGIHWLLNIVTGSKDYPAAVLIRGTKEVYGPARITKYLKIDKKFNGLLSSKKNDLWTEDRGVRINTQTIERKKRIGVDYAGVWAKKLYRFKLV